MRDTFAFPYSIIYNLEIDEGMVQGDPKLPDDGGEIPKSQGRGWWFDSWP
jgi:hypothetical protein